MSLFVPYSTAHHDGWLFSESLTVSGGFVHIITRSTRDGDAHETEVTEYRFSRAGVCYIGLTALVHHRKIPLPHTLAVHFWHEHMLARHQTMYREHPLPYLVQVVASVVGQLGDAIQGLLRRFRQHSEVGSL